MTNNLGDKKVLFYGELSINKIPTPCINKPRKPFKDFV